MSKATGNGRCDVELGIPLVEVMFHELTHALHVLAGTDKGDALPGNITPGTPEADAFRKIWKNAEEYDVVQEENKYNRSRGYSVRARYVNTEEQEDELAQRALRLFQALGGIPWA